MPRYQFTVRLRASGSKDEGRALCAFMLDDDGPVRRGLRIGRDPRCDVVLDVSEAPPVAALYFAAGHHLCVYEFVGGAEYPVPDYPALEALPRRAPDDRFISHRGPYTLRYDRPHSLLDDWFKVGALELRVAFKELAD